MINELLAFTAMLMAFILLNHGIDAGNSWVVAMDFGGGLMLGALSIYFMATRGDND